MFMKIQFCEILLNNIQKVFVPREISAKTNNSIKLIIVFFYIPKFGNFWDVTVPGRASGPSRSRVDDGGGLQYVSSKSVLSFRVFTTKGIYRRKGDVRGWTRGPHHLVAQPGVAPATLWCGCLLAALCLSFGLRLRFR
jgi:hypothetical protein